jgi:hypothetical protein
VTREIESFVQNGEPAILNKTQRAAAEHAVDFETPLYNIWRQQVKTADTNHFGNSEIQWLDNLLYLCTQPFDILMDPKVGITKQAVDLICQEMAGLPKLDKTQRAARNCRCTLLGNGKVAKSKQSSARRMLVKLLRFVGLLLGDASGKSTSSFAGTCAFLVQWYCCQQRPHADLGVKDYFGDVLAFGRYERRAGQLLAKVEKNKGADP